MDPLQRQLLQQLIATYAMKEDGSRNPNGVQDVNQMLMDPLTALLNGGAGAAGLDPGAFAPTVEYKDIDLDIPDEPVGRQMLNAYLAAGDDSPQKIMAEQIEAGMMPEAALGPIAEKFGLDEDGIKELKGLASVFMKEKLDFTQAEADYSRKMAALPRDEQGNIMRQERIETPSPTAEMFREAALSTPDEEFDASYFADTATADANYGNAIGAIKQSVGEGGSLFRMQQQLDSLNDQKRQGVADQERTSAAKAAGLAPMTMDFNEMLRPQNQIQASDLKSRSEQMRIGQAFIDSQLQGGDPTDQGTAIQRALAAQGTSNLQTFPEGSLEALMQQTRTDTVAPTSLLGASSAGRHRGRVANKVEQLEARPTGLLEGSRLRGQEERRNAQNGRVDAQIEQASSALRRERERLDATASKQLRATDGARGAAAAMRFHGQTPLSRQLLARLVSAQG